MDKDRPDEALAPEPVAPEGGTGGAPGDLFSHFVRRTDTSYAGVVDKSLIGEDIGDDDENEDDA